MKPTDITQAQPVLVPENAGTVLNVFGDQFTVKLATQRADLWNAIVRAARPSPAWTQACRSFSLVAHICGQP